MIRAKLAMLMSLVFLAMPGVAHAGCVGSPGTPFWNPSASAIEGFSAISCTTNNGPSYQERVYLQSNDGGWHSLPGVPAEIRRFVNPAGLPNGFASDDLWGNWACQSIAPAATYVRLKTVVENMISLQQGVTAGGAMLLATSCHY